MRVLFSFDATEVPVWAIRLIFSLTVLWLLAIVTIRLLHHASAAVRHRVWGLSVVAALLLPLPVFSLPELSLGWLEAPTAKPASIAAQIPGAEIVNATAASADNGESPNVTMTPPFSAESVSQLPAAGFKSADHIASSNSESATANDGLATQGPSFHPAASEKQWPARGWLVLLAVPTLLGFRRIVRSLAAGRRIVAQSTEIADPACRRALTAIGEYLNPEGEVSNRRSPLEVRLEQLQIRQSNETPVPLCVGWRQPCFILPAGWRAWPPETMRAVIAHELSHVLRRDVLWQILARLACAVYWFHPFVWLAAWRMRIERETACDDSVLRAGEKPAAYARALLSVAEALNTRPIAPTAAVAMAARSDLEQRVRDILATDRRRTAVSRTVGRALAVLTVITALIAAAVSPLSRDATARDLKVASTGAQQPTADNSQAQQKQERKTTPSDKGSTPLAQAVDEFNKRNERQRQSTVMPDSPRSLLSNKSVLPLEALTATDGFPAPLTADEVVTAIIRWNRKEIPVEDEMYRVFQKIVETKQLPAGATLSATTDWITRDTVDGQMYRYHVWWLDLSVMRSEKVGYTYRIRDVQLSRKPTSEAISEFEMRGIVVDEAGVPIPRAELVRPFHVASLRARFRAGEDGRFALTLKDAGYFSIPLDVRNDSGDLQGYFPTKEAPLPQPGVPLPEIRIVLKKPRAIAVAVADSEQRPVAGVAVGAIGGDYGTPLGKQVTDDAGQALLRVPMDAPLTAVYASKPDTGLDYFVVERRGQPVTAEPLSGNPATPLKLVLAGTRPVKLRLVDDRQQPLAGIEVTPHAVWLPIRGSDLSLVGLDEFTVVTDAAGVATFRMLPVENERAVHFFVATTDYISAETPKFDPTSTSNEVAVVMTPTTLVRGHVVLPDGKPAINAEVQLHGVGYDKLEATGFRTLAKSDAEGNFSTLVASEAYYVIAASSTRFGTPGMCLVSRAENRLIRARQPVNPVRLVLQPATRIFGTATAGPDKKPFAKRYVALIQQDRGYGIIPMEQRLPNSMGIQKEITPTIFRGTTTDDQGRFEFFAGPGHYLAIGPDAQISGPDRYRFLDDAAPRPQFEIRDETEIEVLLGNSAPPIKPSGRVVLKAVPQSPATETTPKVPAADPGLVAGEVVHADDGTPVAGALVRLRGPKVEKTTTDAEGRFRFVDMPPGHYQLWSYKDALASARELVVGTEGGVKGARFPHSKLVMKTGKQIELTVTSAKTGQPIEGADVRLAFPDRRNTTTTRDGLAGFQGLLPDKYGITVQAAGHARSEFEFDLSKADQVTHRNFTLEPGGVAGGRVVDESGKPLEGASVTYWAAGTPSGFGGETPQTNTEGQFRHLHLPLNTSVKIQVRKQDYLQQERQITLTDSQREQQLEFKLQPRPRGGSIAGVVTDLQGKPLAGATVRNHGNDPNQKREATTDAEGKFVLHDLLKGYNGHEIVVRSRKFATVMQKVEPGPESAPGQVAVRLEPGHTIRGRVLDPSGNPVKAAYVSANGYGDWGIGETVRTDDKGVFAFDSLPTQTRFMIHGINYPTIQDRELQLDGPETVVVKLESFAYLAGRVVDADTGKPVEEFRIRADFCRDRRPGDANGSYPNALGEPGMVFQSKEGAFLINEMSKGVPLVIVVEAAGYERAVFQRVVAGTSEGDLVKRVALKKRDVSKLATLAGRVVDHRGEALAGVDLRLIVTASPATGHDDNQFNWALINSEQLGRKSYVEQYLSTVSDAQGAFEFKELPAGKFLQIAFWSAKVPKGRSLALAKTKPGVSQSTVLKIPEPARVMGSVDPRLFAGAGEIQVNYDEEAFLSFRGTLGDKKNTFTIENLPPGKCHVSITSQPERHKDNPSMSTVRSLATRKLTIEPGQTYEIEFTKEDVVTPR